MRTFCDLTRIVIYGRRDVQDSWMKVNPWPTYLKQVLCVIGDFIVQCNDHFIRREMDRKRECVLDSICCHLRKNKMTSALFTCIHLDENKFDRTVSNIYQKTISFSAKEISYHGHKFLFSPERRPLSLYISTTRVASAWLHADIYWKSLKTLAENFRTFAVQTKRAGRSLYILCHLSDPSLE